MKLNLLPILALSLCFFGSISAAENKRAECHKPHLDAAKKTMLMDKFDANSDGKLDEAERGQAKAAMQAKRNEHLATLKSEKPELFARIDTDGNGEISREEGQAARHKMKERAESKCEHKGDAKGERGTERQGERDGDKAKRGERRESGADGERRERKADGEHGHQHKK